MDNLQQDAVLPQSTSPTDGYSGFITQDPSQLIKQTPPPPAMTGGEYGNLVTDAQYTESVKPEAGWGDLFHRAWQQDATIQQALTSGHDYPYNPDFTPTKEQMDFYGKGLPDETQIHLLTANSAEHMQSIRDQALHELENETVLGNAGIKGFAARMAVSVVDPVQLVANVATGWGAGAAVKGAMLTRMAAGGVIAGATNASIEAYLNSKQLTRDDSGVVVAGALGMALGSVGGAFSPSESSLLRLAGNKIADSVQLDDIAKNGEKFGLTVRKVGESTQYYQKQADRLVTELLGDNLKDAPVGVHSVIADMFANGAKRSEVKELLKEMLPDIEANQVTAKQSLVDTLAALKESVKAKEVDQTFTASKIPTLEELTLGIKLDSLNHMQKLMLQAAIKTGDKEAIKKVAKLITTDIAHSQHAEVAATQKAIVDKEEAALWNQHEVQVTKAKMLHDKQAEETVKEVLGTDDPWHLNQSMGAAQVPGSIIEMDSPANFVKVKIPFTDFEIPLRYDLFSIMERQHNPVFRWFNKIAHPNAAGGGLNGSNAMEHAQMLYQQGFGKYKLAANDALKEYLLDNPVSLWKRHESVREFDRLVSQAKRNPDMEVHPAIRKLANEMTAVQEMALREAQRHGVDGAEDIKAAVSYLNRQFSNDSRLMLIARLEDALGSKAAAEDAIVDTIAKAIHSAREIKPEKAKTIAKAYYKTVRLLQYSSSLKGGVMGDKQYAMLRKALDEINIDSGDIEGVMELITGRPHDPEAVTKGVIPRFQARTLMDENFVNEIAPGVKLSVQDLFENSSEKLMHSYLKQLSGATALAKQGIKSVADFERLLKDADEWASSAGIDREVHVKHARYVNDTFKTLMGIPLEDNPGSMASRSLGILKDWNFTTNMGQAGMAQFPDLGNLIGYVGNKIFMQQLPAMGDILKTLKGGVLDDQLAKDLHMMYGIGTDMMNHPDIVPLAEVPFNKGIKAIENVMSVGKFTTSRVSGMSSINNFLHQVSYRAVMAKIIDDALGSSKLNDVQWDKLATAGLSKGDVTELGKLLPKYTSMTDGKLSGIDYEGLFSHNPDLADKFKIAVHREARRAVQQQLRGENHPWMHTQVGQLLFQFRSFMLAAFPKQLLYGLSHMDRHTIMSWAYSSMFAGLSYAAQNSINYAGNQEELDRRLAPKEIAKAAFQRAGYSSVLPGAIDTVTDFTSGEPVFRYGRTTGNSTGFITGNPTFNRVTQAVGTVQHISRAAFDDEYNATSKEVKNGMQTILPNYLLIRNFINSVSNQYPSHNPLRQPEE